MPETLNNRKPTPLKSTMTLRETFVVENRNGLHARPAALLVKQVSPFKCEVTAECGGEVACAKSILGLLGLAAGPTSRITFIATGRDAAEAVEAIRHLFGKRFDEVR